MIGQLNKQQLEIMRLVVWEKLTRSDEYRTEYFDLINPRIEDGLAAHMEKYNAFVEKWQLPTPLHPDWNWEDIAEYKDHWKWFIGHAIKLMHYPGVSKTFLKKVAERLSVELPNIKEEIDKLPSMANKRFSRKTWEDGYKAWDLIENQGLSVEDAALTLGKSSKTVYRWYTDIGKHTIGESFKGKQRDRESYTLYTGSLNDYAYAEKRAMERKIEDKNWQFLPRTEQLRLQEQYVQRNGVTVCPTIGPKRKKLKGVKVESVEYIATTSEHDLGAYFGRVENCIIGNIDIQKIRYLCRCLRRSKVVLPDCSCQCLYLHDEVEDEWCVVGNEEFRALLEQHGISYKWREIVGIYPRPMNSPHLYENYLDKEGFFLPKDAKNFVKEGTNESQCNAISFVKRKKGSRR